MSNLQLFTIKEVASTLGVSTNVVHNYIRAGKIDSLKMGGSRRFTQKHIEDFIKSLENNRGDIA